MKWLLPLLLTGFTIIKCHGILHNKNSKPPLLTAVPETTFSCTNRPGGYYADIEANCQSYHMCDGNRNYSFLCPHLTLFHQKYMVCNHYSSVDCPDSEKYFDLNLNIGKVDKKSDPSDAEDIFTNDINDIDFTSLNAKSSAKKSNGNHVKRESTSTSSLKFLSNSIDSSSHGSQSKFFQKKIGIPILGESLNGHNGQKTPVTEIPEPSKVAQTVGVKSTTEPFKEEIEDLTVSAAPMRDSTFLDDPIILERNDPTSFTVVTDEFPEIKEMDFIEPGSEIVSTRQDTTSIFLNEGSTTTADTPTNRFIETSLPNTSPFEVEGMFENIDEDEFSGDFGETPSPFTVPTEQTHHEILDSEITFPEKKTVKSQFFTFKDKDLKVIGRGGGKISFKKKFQKKIKPFSTKFKPDFFMKDLFISDDDTSPIFISSDFDEISTPIPTTLQPPPPPPVFKEIKPPEIPPIARLLEPPSLLPAVKSLQVPTVLSTELEPPKFFPQNMLKPIHPLLSRFLKPPEKNFLKLHGHYQEEDTPLSIQDVSFKSFEASHDSQNIRLGKHLPSLRGNPDFFIPAKGLIPPLPESSVEISDNSLVPEDHHMTMKFTDRHIGRSGAWAFNPSCPRCHPAFLKPGQCTPCVIIR